jgi:DNA polymerase elongation subunit (family B)
MDRFFCHSVYTVPNTNDVYMFGVYEDASCCLLVTDVRRSILILPKAGCSIHDVETEHDFKDFDTVVRRIAFEAQPTRSATMLHMRPLYSDKIQIGKSKSIQRIYGVRVTPLEAFMLAKKMRLPSWVAFPDNAATWHDVGVWSARQFRCDADHIRLATNQDGWPPVSVVALDFEANKITYVHQPVFHIYAPTKNPGPQVMERECGTSDIQSFLTEKLLKMDPDVILVYGTKGIRGLMKRKNTSVQTPGQYCWTRHTSGRLLFDIQQEATEITTGTDYSIKELAMQELEAKEPTDGRERANAMLQLLHKFHTLQRIYNIQHITGCSVPGASQSAQATWLLLHAFSVRNYIVPEDMCWPHEDSYKGGQVLDSVPGLHDDTIVALLDFRSLYPGIIREFGLCFSTIEYWKPHAELPKSRNNGVLPQVVSELLDRRQSIKRDMTDDLKRDDPNAWAQMHYRQNALKLVVNKLVGCFGMTHFRFRSSTLAGLITRTGRKMLSDAVTTATEMGTRVIFGDTDSIMIDTHTCSLDASHMTALGICAAIDKQYVTMTMEPEKLYRQVLIFNKKSYAGIDVTPTSAAFIQKGLFRRDQSGFSRRYYRQALLIALSRKDSIARRSQLRALIEYAKDELLGDIVTNADGASSSTETTRVLNINMRLLRVTQRLKKHLREYEQQSVFPHVVVARQIGAVRGEFISYYVMEDGPEHSLKTSVGINTEWYLREVRRLIEGVIELI